MSSGVVGGTGEITFLEWNIGIGTALGATINPPLDRDQSSSIAQQYDGAHSKFDLDGNHIEPTYVCMRSIRYRDVTDQDRSDYEAMQDRFVEAVIELTGLDYQINHL